MVWNCTVAESRGSLSVATMSRGHGCSREARTTGPLRARAGPQLSVRAMRRKPNGVECCILNDFTEISCPGICMWSHLYKEWMIYS